MFYLCYSTAHICQPAACFSQICLHNNSLSNVRYNLTRLCRADVIEHPAARLPRRPIGAATNRYCVFIGCLLFRHIKQPITIRSFWQIGWKGIDIDVAADCAFHIIAAWKYQNNQIKKCTNNDFLTHASEMANAWAHQSLSHYICAAMAVRVRDT